MKIYNRIMIVLSCLGLVFSLIFTINCKPEYNLLWLLPLIYLLTYVFVFQFVFRNKSSRITMISLSVLLFLKSVLNPVFILWAGIDYTGKRYIYLSEESIRMAILLSVYELIVVSLFSFIISIVIKQDRNLRFQKEWNLGGSKLVYKVFILFAILLYFLIGRKANVVSFLSLSLSSGYIPIESTMLVLVRQIITVSIAISFILLVNYFKKKYDATNKLRYVNYAVVAAIMNISVIVGNRRSVQLFTGILSILILTKAFPKNRNRIAITILCAVGLVFTGMTLHRWGAFEYGSYLNAASSTTSEISAKWLADYAQIYFGGPDAIATSIEFSKNVNLSLKNLFFDFGRTTFGISFILKNGMNLTSELYNLFLYNGKQLTGQLIFSTSYGYIFLGFLGAPLIMILNIAISVGLEKLFRRAKTYETAYLFGYCLLRMALNLLTNTPTIISIITQQLGTLGLLILFSRLFVKREINQKV